MSDMDNLEGVRGKLIGEILVEKGIITFDQLKEALAAQKEKKDFICSLITKLGFAQPNEVFKVLSSHIGVEYVDLKKETVDTKAVEKVPAKFALHYKMMPFKFESGKLVIALSDPLDVNKLDDLKLLLDTDIKVVLSYDEDIIEHIQKYYGVGAETLEEIMNRADVKSQAKERSTSVEDLETASQEASIIKFVNQIFTQAVDERATDIHLEPFEDELRVRFRIDGFLYEVPIPESIKLFHQHIVSRIKVMAHLDIAEHRLSQDGRIKIRVRDEELDLRVSILPSSYGESVQIRILSRRDFLGLENLGLLDDDRKKVDQLMNKPYGIIFVTGPTGSGKSTTLYAALSKKNQTDAKIITIEDPIEYQIRGITQMQVHPRINLTFANGLRSILRHDPDIIMVGEVRDMETAEITIRSAMTGHLVFSTLHTNDASSAPVRLVEMGIEPFLAASSMEGIVAQRLVRVICPDCKAKKTVPAELFKREGIELDDGEAEVFEGRGCEKCRFTRFRGRTAIFEILLMNENIRDMIFKNATGQMIKQKALESGMNTLRQDGLRKVLKGVTTISEILRVA